MTPLHETATRSPSDVLIEHLGLARRTQAEVEDLYSRPLRKHVTVITPMAPAASVVTAVATPDLEAAGSSAGAGAPRPEPNASSSAPEPSAPRTHRGPEAPPSAPSPPAESGS